MKIAVNSRSGYVAKTTIAMHLLQPPIKSNELVSVESANADEQTAEALRGT